MNQFIKMGKLKLLFSFLICSFLLNQNAELITQKIDVEKLQLSQEKNNDYVAPVFLSRQEKIDSIHF